MDTHLTLINEDVVREREDALHRAHDRAEAANRARVEHIPAAHGTTETDEVGRGAGRRRHGGADLFVVTLFAVLAAGFVSLVATSLRL
jgi:hypothetical protein